MLLSSELTVTAVNFITKYKNITLLSVALCMWVDGNVVEAIGAHRFTIKCELLHVHKRRRAYTPWCLRNARYLS